MENKDKEAIIDAVLKEQKIVKYISYFKKAMSAAMDKHSASQNEELKERVKKLEFMINNGLGWNDMKNDNI